MIRRTALEYDPPRRQGSRPTPPQRAAILAPDLPALPTGLVRSRPAQPPKPGALSPAVLGSLLPIAVRGIGCRLWPWCHSGGSTPLPATNSAIAISEMGQQRTDAAAQRYRPIFGARASPIAIAPLNQRGGSSMRRRQVIAGLGSAAARPGQPQSLVPAVG
jgi:hypothetical protein